MPNSELGINVNMDKAFCNITFTVKDTASGLPIEGAAIDIKTMQDEVTNVEPKLTDAQGVAKFTDYPSTTQFKYTVTKSGYTDISGTLNTL